MLRLRRKSARTDEALPVYMHPIEFSQLLAIVESIAARRCLEWGSGGSTRALLERCPFIEHYVSVEHNAAWHAQVQKHVVDPRLSLNLVLPDVPGPAANARKLDIEAWEARAEDDRTLLRSYIEFPRSTGHAFDFVLVDGRARNFCVAEGFSLLAPGGVLVIHDAQRTEYHAAIAALGRPTYLEPWESGQICLVRKG